MGHRHAASSRSGCQAAPILPRRARRRPEKTERPHPRRRGHPINHHVAGRRQRPRTSGKPGCPASPSPGRHRRSPVLGRKDPASPRNPPAPAPRGSLPPPPYDLLPDSRLKGASGAAMRTLRAPRPARPLSHDPGSYRRQGAHWRTPATHHTGNPISSAGTTCGAHPIQVSRYSRDSSTLRTSWLFRSIRGRRAWFASRATAQASPTGTEVPELVGVAHRADRLNLPVEYVERQGKEHLAVPITEDRSRLAVHLAWLQRHVQPDEPGEDCGKHPGHLLSADDAPGQRRGLAAAVPDHLNVSGEQLPQAVDVPFPEGVEEPLGEFLALA